MTQLSCDREPHLPHLETGARRGQFTLPELPQAAGL